MKIFKVSTFTSASKYGPMFTVKQVLQRCLLEELSSTLALAFIFSFKPPSASAARLAILSSISSKPIDILSPTLKVTSTVLVSVSSGVLEIFSTPVLLLQRKPTEPVSVPSALTFPSTDNTNCTLAENTRPVSPSGSFISPSRISLVHSFSSIFTSAFMVTP